MSETKRKRTKHSPQTKAKVALSAIVATKPLADIAKEYGISPTQVTQWKKIGLEGLYAAFTKEKTVATSKPSTDLSSLFKEIDKLAEGNSISDDSEDSDDSEEYEE